uniref:transmembrane protein 237 n=1 Tax=Myxine glutinosa TaxID=7769 RepID=UPI00358E16BD
MEPFPRALPPLPGKETFEEVPLSPVRMKRRDVTRKQTSVSRTVELPDAQLDNDDQSPDKHASASRKKRTQRKKNTKLKHSPLPDDISVEEEDVVSAPPVVEASGVENLAQVCSQPSGVFFVESKGGFRVSEKPWEYCQKGGELVEEQVVQSTTQDVARRAQETFCSLGLFCGGLLAGVALWDAVLLCVTAGPSLSNLGRLYSLYQLLAAPSQALFSVLLAVCTVSAFDRANLARPLPFLRHLLTFDPSTWASLAYLSALIVSLGLAMTSDRIRQGINPSNSRPEMQWLKSWLAARLTISILCGLAWLELAWSPVPDCTFETFF